MRLVNTRVYRIKLWRWNISKSGLNWYLRNLSTINFRTPKLAKKGLFCGILIFAHSCCAKINGIKVILVVVVTFIAVHLFKFYVAAAQCHLLAILILLSSLIFHAIFVNVNWLQNDVFDDCNGIRTHNHLSQIKWLSVRLRIKWSWVRILLQSLKLQISRPCPGRSSLTFRQLQSVDSL